MRYILLLFLIISVSFASEQSTATKITERLIVAIDNSDKPIWFTSDDPELANMLDLSYFDTTSECEKAAVLVLSYKVRIPTKCQDTPILVLDYDLFKEYDKAVSAFFWKKGRPNIVFLEERLQHFNITLPQSYDKYIEEQLW